MLADSELPRTHDIELLVEQVEGAGTKVPDELSGTDWLTPGVAELRYDEPVALDRQAALVVAESAVSWAESLLADASAPGPQGSIQGFVLSESDFTQSDQNPATTGNPTPPDSPGETS